MRSASLAEASSAARSAAAANRSLTRASAARSTCATTSLARYAQNSARVHCYSYHAQRRSLKAGSIEECMCGGGDGVAQGEQGLQAALCVKAEEANDQEA